MENFIKKIFYSDNIDIISTINKSSIDLIYLDPPFNSNRNYKYIDYTFDSSNISRRPLAFRDVWNVYIKDELELKGYIEKIFTLDSYSTDFIAFANNIFMAMFYSNRNMLDYMIFLTLRLYALRNILKDSGSIFLHCDPTASHYIKIIMDAIYGSENFRNEIVWQYDGPQGPSSKKLSTKHDIILWYVKDVSKAKINKEHLYENIKLEESELKNSAYRQDEEGRWYYDLPRGSYNDKSIERLEGEGRIRRTKNNKIRIKYFLDKDKDGVLIRKKKISDVWSNILSLGLISSSEKNGYPTQKPITLLERIINITTDENDIVFDPFLGSGTTIVASENLGRKWIGVDESILSINTVGKRMASEFEDLELGKDYNILGLPCSRHDFENMIEQGKALECKHFLLNKLGAEILNNKKKNYISGYIYSDDNSCPMPIVINTDKDFTIEKLEHIVSSVCKKDESLNIIIIIFANIDKNIYNHALQYGNVEINNNVYNKVQILTLESVLLDYTFSTFEKL